MVEKLFEYPAYRLANVLEYVECRYQSGRGLVRSLVGYVNVTLSICIVEYLTWRCGDEN
jgi:hypothetical protein